MGAGGKEMANVEAGAKGRCARCGTPKVLVSISIPRSPSALLSFFWGGYPYSNLSIGGPSSFWESSSISI